MNENAETEAAEYFGLKVEVICRILHWFAFESGRSW